jgi:NAD(P)-dependent dehydrogenase (short-subunit alcohol dehydrogenase family)
LTVQVKQLGLEAGSPAITVIRADMGEAEDATSLADKAIAANGEIDVLVLNHALIDDSLVLEYQDEAALQRHVLSPMRVNYVGSVRLARAALPSLERSSGRIVVVSSGESAVCGCCH